METTSKSNILVSHPHGNTFSRALISVCEEKKILAEFDTAIAINSSALWLKILPVGIREEIMRRTFPIDLNKIHTYPMRELARMILPKIGLKHFTRHEIGWASVYSVYREFDLSVSKRLSELSKEENLTAVYAYEDGALKTFEMAKKLGVKCIYDLPIAYWEVGRRLMMEEAERLPKWNVTLGGGIIDSSEKLDRKVQELEMADLVICPGSFVMESLPLWAKDKKVLMAPFGSPINLIKNEDILEDKASKGPLRILFVGSMGQRKGLGDLFEAVKKLNRKDIELVVMGSLRAPLEFYKSEFPNFIYEPGRSHDQVLGLMRSCDVFCLPSIVEGRALVMQEAMSQGLPIIITPNTGGSDLVIEGETGFLVPIRSPDIIGDKIEWFLDNRNKIKEMGEMAKKHAATYTWRNYALSIIDSIQNLK